MPRYAIYYVPEQTSPLWRFGSSAIGYDAWTSEDVPFPDHPLYRRPEARAWTEEPRRYGFHGTLKAPFELGEGDDEAGLLRAARDFAGRHGAVSIPSLELRTLGTFIALMPGAPAPSLDELAAACVREFDPFRAPLSPEDRERRLRSPLSPRQIELLDRWGYPYVMEEFRFHMTLSGALDEGPRAAMLDALRGIYQQIAAPSAIDTIAVCRQGDRHGRFVVRARFPLSA